MTLYANSSTCFFDLCLQLRSSQKSAVKIILQIKNKQRKKEAKDSKRTLVSLVFIEPYWMFKISIFSIRCFHYLKSRLSAGCAQDFFPDAKSVSTLRSTVQACMPTDQFGQSWTFSDRKNRKNNWAASVRTEIEQDTADLRERDFDSESSQAMCSFSSSHFKKYWKFL